MSKNKSLKLNFIMNAILTMSQFAFPLITFPYISRVLQPAGTGMVSFATSVVAYFCMFSQLGIPTYGIRACAKVRDDKETLSRTVQELFLINLIMCIFTYIAFFIALFTVPKFSQNKPLFLIISLTILFNAIGVEWLYKALEQYTYITVRSIIFKFIALVFMFLLVKQPDDTVIYGGLSILAASASNIFNFFHVHKYIQLKPIGNCRFRLHLKAILIFFAMSCATTIYTNLDTVMLGFMKTDVDVGYYNAAVKIKNVLLGVVTSLGTVLLPRASYYVEHDMMEEFYRVAKKAITFCFLTGHSIISLFYVICKGGHLLPFRLCLQRSDPANADYYANVIVDWTDQYYGNPDAGSTRKRKNRSLFRNCRCHYRFGIKCNFNPTCGCRSWGGLWYTCGRDCGLDCSVYFFAQRCFECLQKYSIQVTCFGTCRRDIHIIIST